MNSRDAIAVARKARASAGPAGPAAVVGGAESRGAVAIEPAEGEYAHAPGRLRRMLGRGPVRVLRALLSAPARPLAEEASRHSAELRRQVADVEHKLWLQTNHITHVVDSLAQTMWLDSNHVHAELRQIRRAVGASDGSSTSNQDSHSAMLMELLLQQQVLASTVAHLAARFDALIASGDSTVVSGSDLAAVHGADRVREAAP